MTKASDLGKWAIGINSLPANIIRTIGVGIGTTNPTVMLDVSECIKASQLNVSGISTISTLISPSLVAGSTLDEVNITGFTTSTSGVSVAGVNVSGAATVAGLLDGNKGMHIVAGSLFDEVNITGITTVGGLLDANKGSNVIAGATFDEVNITGFTTTSSGVNITAGGLNVAGVTTISKMVNADKGLTVTAGSSLQEVNISGLSTFSGDAEILVGAAITIGRTGVSTFVSDLHVGGSQAAGVVLTSPDGTRYRLVVANGGALSTSAV